MIVLGNFFVDSPDRLEQLINSFGSFYDAYKFDRWIINCRGRYAIDVGEFLASKIDSASLLFFSFESKKGWFYDSAWLAQKAPSQNIFLWVEDHVFINSRLKFAQMIMEFESSALDVMGYSWWHQSTRDFFNLLECESDSGLIKGFELDFTDRRQRNLFNEARLYVVGMQSLFRRQFFEDCLIKHGPRLRRWHPNLPFDLEKTPDDLRNAKVKVGFLKEEMACSIDDDHGDEGYSLVARGVYPDTRRVLTYHIESGVKLKIKQGLKSNFPTLLLVVSSIYKLLRRVTYTAKYVFYLSDLKKVLKG